jgi:hypothetical protein
MSPVDVEQTASLVITVLIKHIGSVWLDINLNVNDSPYNSHHRSKFKRWKHLAKHMCLFYYRYHDMDHQGAINNKGRRK